METLRKRIKFLVVFLLIFSLILSVLFLKKNPKKAKEIKSPLVQLSVLENQDESYYDELVEKLIMCESSGNCLSIVPYDGGSASLACLQWKPETFKEYALKYGVIGEKASLNYIMTIIWNKNVNKYLAIQILKNEPEKAKQLWYNCWRKINKK
jgi:hypothetical protein